MTRSPIVPAALLVAAMLAAPASAQARQATPHSYPIPETLTLAGATVPTWVAASVALTASGELNAAAFGGETARIREILDTPSDQPVYFNGKIVSYQDRPSMEGCRPVGASFFDYPNPPRRGSLNDAIADSKVALFGRITGKAYGFYAGDPGQLFQVEPLRSYGQALTKARYYFFIPIGRFQFGGIEICKTDERYAQPPQVGGEVFLFVGAPADREDVLFHVLDPGDVVVVEPDGTLRLPRQYTAGEEGAAKRSSSTPTSSELLARMDAARAKAAHP
jgi:hypothetical protein